MIQKICSNPVCKKDYSVENQYDDDGYCSFECWEKENCSEPQETIFEKISLI